MVGGFGFFSSRHHRILLRGLWFAGCYSPAWLTVLRGPVASDDDPGAGGHLQGGYLQNGHRMGEIMIHDKL